MRGVMAAVWRQREERARTCLGVGQVMQGSAA